MMWHDLEWVYHAKLNNSAKSDLQLQEVVVISAKCGLVWCDCCVSLLQITVTNRHLHIEMRALVTTMLKT